MIVDGEKLLHCQNHKNRWNLGGWEEPDTFFGPDCPQEQQELNLVIDFEWIEWILNWLDQKSAMKY